MTELLETVAAELDAVLGAAVDEVMFADLVEAVASHRMAPARP